MDDCGPVLYTFGLNADFVGDFLRRRVRFLIVGGLAVKYFCPKRDVRDLDLMIDPTLENAERIVQALDLFCPGHGLAPARLVGPGKQLPLKQHLYLDVLTPRLETPSFDELWQTAIPARLLQHEVRIPSRDSMLKLKRFAADTDADPERRMKHQADVDCLAKFQSEP